MGAKEEGKGESIFKEAKLPWKRKHTASSISPPGSAYVRSPSSGYGQINLVVWLVRAAKAPSEPDGLIPMTKKLSEWLVSRSVGKIPNPKALAEARDGHAGPKPAKLCEWPPSQAWSPRKAG